MESFDTLCGIGYFRPKFLQRFANRGSYLVIHSLMACSQGLLFTYMSGVLSTLEKQFQIRSEYSAWVMSGNELSQIVMIVFLPAIAKVRRPPLWIAVGMMVSVVGYLLISLANFTVTLPEEVVTMNSTESIFGGTNKNGFESLCHNYMETLEMEQEKCSAKSILKSRGSGHIPGILLIFWGLFFAGFGTSVFYSLSMAYMDDNMTRKASPIFIALSFALRLCGAFLGAILASGFLNIYVRPTQKPDFGESDPRWIGAWWIGPPLIGLLCFICGIVVSLFPRRLHIDGSQMTDAAAKAKLELQHPSFYRKEVSLKDKWKPIARIFRNKLFVCNMFASVTSFFIISGFATFSPKFFQIWLRFGEAASGRGLGFMIFAQLFAIVAGGLALSKWQPRARYIAYYNCFASFCFMMGILAMSFIDCERSPWIDKDSILLDCAKSCNCNVDTFNPVCVKELNLNVFSPCLAGCSESIELMDIPKCKDDGGDCSKSDNSTLTKMTFFSNCTCLELNLKKILKIYKLQGVKNLRPIISSEDALKLTVTKGECKTSEDNCKTSYYVAITIMFFIAFVNNLGRIGGVLLQIRCIDVRDKAVSFAIVSVALSMFSQFPSPLIYGRLFDTSCAEFRTICGKTGDCLHYDNELFRFWVLRMTCIFGIVPLFADLAVVKYVGNLDLYSEPDFARREEDEEEDDTREIAETRL